MGTKPIEGWKRTDGGWVGDPHSVVIAGFDNGDTFPANPLVDEGSNATSDETLEPLVNAIEVAGFVGTIDATKLGGEIVAVNGRRRVRALRILNTKRKAAGQEPLTISVKLVTADPKRRNLGLFAAVVTMNEHGREKTPYERCRQAVQMQAYGATVADIAAIFGVEGNTVRGWLDIADVAPVAQQAIASGAIPAVAAKHLKDLPEQVQAETVAEVVAEGGGKAGEKAITAVIAKKGQRSSHAAPKRGKKEIRALLQEAADTYACWYGGNAGDTSANAFEAGAEWAIGDRSDQEVGLKILEKARAKGEISDEVSP